MFTSDSVNINTWYLTRFKIAFIYSWHGIVYDYDVKEVEELLHADE